MEGAGLTTRICIRVYIDIKVLMCTVSTGKAMEDMTMGELDELEDDEDEEVLLQYR